MGTVDSSDLTAQRWAEWAKTATTDTVPDVYKGETLPDGTVADRPWWYHGDTLKAEPPE